VKIPELADLWQFTVTTNAWRTTPIPFIQDNPQNDKKGAGFLIGYNINENDYSDSDTSAILNNILKLPDTAENRAMVNDEFNKGEFFYEPNTNIAIYAWSVKVEDYPDVSRKDCKKAGRQGSANADCDMFRSTDTQKVMEHYKIKDKKSKKDKLGKG